MYSLIIVDFFSIERTLQFIEECMDKIIDSEELNYIIIDNTPQRYAHNELCQKGYSLEKIKNSAEDVESYSFILHSQTIILADSGKNLGYGGGNNLGARVAADIFDDIYFVFSNNDLLFPEPFRLFDLQEKMKKTADIAVIGPNIIGQDDGAPQSPFKYQNMWQQTVMNFYHMLSDKLFSGYESNLDYSEESKKCYWVCGCFMMVQASDFFRVNGFDEKTFLYGEEMILSERMKTIGKDCFFMNDITIIHDHGKTVHKHMSELKRLELSVKSSWYYFKTYRNETVVKIFFTRVLFLLFEPLYLLKATIKGIIGRNK